MSREEANEPTFSTKLSSNNLICVERSTDPAKHKIRERWLTSTSHRCNMEEKCKSKHPKCVKGTVKISDFDRHWNSQFLSKFQVVFLFSRNDE